MPSHDPRTKCRRLTGCIRHIEKAFGRHDLATGNHPVIGEHQSEACVVTHGRVEIALCDFHLVGGIQHPACLGLRTDRLPNLLIQIVANGPVRSSPQHETEDLRLRAGIIELRAFRIGAVHDAFGGCDIALLLCDPIIFRAIVSRGIILDISGTGSHAHQANDLGTTIQRTVEFGNVLRGTIIKRADQPVLQRLDEPKRGDRFGHGVRQHPHGGRTIVIVALGDDLSIVQRQYSGGALARHVIVKRKGCATKTVVEIDRRCRRQWQRDRCGGQAAGGTQRIERAERADAVTFLAASAERRSDRITLGLTEIALLGRCAGATYIGKQHQRRRGKTDPQASQKSRHLTESPCRDGARLGQLGIELE